MPKKKKTATEEIAPTEATVSITATEEGTPSVEVNKPRFTISHHTAEWFSSRARLEEGRHSKLEKDLLTDADGVTYCEGSIRVVHLDRMTFAISIDAGEPNLEAYENEYQDCDLITTSVESSIYTRGMEYGIVLSTVGAVLKATSKAHNVRTVLVGTTRKRCLEVADSLEQSFDLILDLAYTQSYESIVTNVVQALFGANLLAASFIRALVGDECFAFDFEHSPSDLPEVTVRKIRDGYGIMDEIDLQETEQDDADISIEVAEEVEEIEPSANR